MANSVTVSYGRKRTDKLGDGSFDAVELGSTLTINDLPDDESPLLTQVEVFKALRVKVDEEFDSIEKHPLAVLRAIPEQQTQVTNNVVEERAPDAVPAKPSGPLGWLKDKVDSETANIQQRMATLPGEHLSGTGSSGEAGDDFGTPPVSSIKANEAVAYFGCRVFESKVAKASNGNEYCAIRVGKRGQDGIPGQYTTARSFDGKIVEQAKRIRDGDMVDIYGYFKAWKNDAEKFDLELQKIEMSS